MLVLGKVSVAHRFLDACTSLLDRRLKANYKLVARSQVVQFFGVRLEIIERAIA